MVASLFAVPSLMGHALWMQVGTLSALISMIAEL
jgi:hypothetical protein